MEMLTREEKATHYAAMLDSVQVIETLAGATDEDALDAIERNKTYLRVMLGRSEWGDQDLTAIEAALSPL